LRLITWVLGLWLLPDQPMWLTLAVLLSVMPTGTTVFVFRRRVDPDGDIGGDPVGPVPDLVRPDFNAGNRSVPLPLYRWRDISISPTQFYCTWPISEVKTVGGKGSPGTKIFNNLFDYSNKIAICYRQDAHYHVQ